MLKQKMYWPGAMLKYARAEVQAGPVSAPRAKISDKPSITLLGEMFPADPIGIGMMLDAMDLSVGPVVPTREWRELYQALDCAAVAAIHPFYTASIREFEAAGRVIVGSAPIGYEGTANWLEKIAKSCNVSEELLANAKNKFLPAIKAAISNKPD
jgi:chlorophyllide a reductase subunit Y